MPWRSWGSALFARQVPDNLYCQGVRFTPWRGSGSGRIYTVPGSEVPSGVPWALLLLCHRRGTIKFAKTRIFYWAYILTHILTHHHCCITLKHPLPFFLFCAHWRMFENAIIQECEWQLIKDSRAGLLSTDMHFRFSFCLWLPTYLSTYLSSLLEPVTQNCLANLQIWNPFVRK